MEAGGLPSTYEPGVKKQRNTNYAATVTTVCTSRAADRVG